MGDLRVLYTHEKGDLAVAKKIDFNLIRFLSSVAYGWS
jgi:hypothetical protein